MNTVHLNATHGGSKWPEYRVWVLMKQRCERIANREYPLYGARGIRVCARWHSFADFITDMGRRPSSSHQIDRIDNDGNYEPGNCRWVTAKENCANRRIRSDARLLSFSGKTLPAGAWERILGLRRGALLEVAKVKGRAFAEARLARLHPQRTE